MHAGGYADRKEEREREGGRGGGREGVKKRRVSRTGNTQKEKRNGTKEGNDEKRKNEVGTGYPSPPSWSTLINLLS